MPKKKSLRAKAKSSKNAHAEAFVVAQRLAIDAVRSFALDREHSFEQHNNNITAVTEVFLSLSPLTSGTATRDEIQQFIETHA